MIQVELLGTIEVLRDGMPFRMERRAQRLLMGLLALDAGQLVSSSYLIEMLWGSQSPASARATLHSRISELRSLLARQGLGDTVVELRSVGTGYCLDIAPDNVDSHRFLELVGGWRQSPTAEAALDRLTRALDLWRGPVFGGLTLEATPSALEKLAAARLTALEDYFMINLHLGHHVRVVDRLTEAAGANPTRERLIAQCMLAQYRAGRAAEALTMYANWRAWLQDALGTDPSAEVQQVYLAILRNEDPGPLGEQPFPEPVAVVAAPPTVEETPPLVARSTLPPPEDGFTGRDAETAELVGLVTGARERLIAVSGPAGVGKTALTVHVAHQVAAHFPDGQLFADLHGYDDERPEETAYRVLGRFLRVLGTPADAVPHQFDERVDLYRQLLAGRRVLVILDNVAGDDQVGPLLSAGESCQIIVNGRTRLGAASGARHVGLREMPDSQARELLTVIAGEQRVAGDPHGTVELIRRCGNLPLALRIAGAKLATKPHWSIARLVRLLATDSTRLSHLTHQQMSVAARIRQSFCRVTPPAQRLLTVMSTLDLADIPVWVAAALLDTDTESAERLLEELFDASLVDIGGRDTRYRVSDLVRDYGRERAGNTLDEPDLRAARRRAYVACLSTLDAAHRRVNGSSRTVDGAATGHPAGDRPAADAFADDALVDPAAWFDRERALIASMVTMAASDRCPDECGEIAAAASGFFRMHGCLAEWQRILETAASVLDNAGSDRGRAIIGYRLGQLWHERGDDPRARAEYSRAAGYFDRCDDDHGGALAEAGRAGLSGDDDTALLRYHDAGRRLAAAGDVAGAADVSGAIGRIHLRRLEYGPAARHFDAAAQAFDEIGSPRGRTQVLTWRSMLRLATVDAVRSYQGFRAALESNRSFGDRSGTLQCLRGAALAARAMGDHGTARTLLDELSAVRRSLPGAHDQPRRTVAAVVVKRPTRVPARPVPVAACG